MRPERQKGEKEDALFYREECQELSDKNNVTTQNDKDSTSIPGYYTRQGAADLLGVTPQRVSAIARRDNWRRSRIGPSWLYNQADVEHTFVKTQARRAWRILGIPSKLWREPWLDDVDAIGMSKCPNCGSDAYSPAGEQKWSNQAACPTCGWQSLEK